MKPSRLVKFLHLISAYIFFSCSGGRAPATPSTAHHLLHRKPWKHHPENQHRYLPLVPHVRGLQGLLHPEGSEESRSRTNTAHDHQVTLRKGDNINRLSIGQGPPLHDDGPQLQYHKLDLHYWDCEGLDFLSLALHFPLLLSCTQGNILLVSYIGMLG